MHNKMKYLCLFATTIFLPVQVPRWPRIPLRTSSWFEWFWFVFFRRFFRCPLLTCDISNSEWALMLAMDVTTPFIRKNMFRDAYVLRYHCRIPHPNVWFGSIKIKQPQTWIRRSVTSLSHITIIILPVRDLSYCTIWKWGETKHRTNCFGLPVHLGLLPSTITSFVVIPMSCWQSYPVMEKTSWDILDKWVAHSRNYFVDFYHLRIDFINSLRQNIMLIAQFDFLHFNNQTEVVTHLLSHKIHPHKPHCYSQSM